MRDILYKAKIINGEEWVEGIAIKNHIGVFICFDENPHYCSQYGYMEIDSIVRVDESTICQYIGLTDKNGKKIFEGDILSGQRYRDWGQGGEYIPDKCVIKWNDKHAAFEPVYWWKEYNHNLKDYEVIGNIFDNPELLNEAGQ